MTRLDRATLDAIAGVLTDDVLRPFDVPRRPFLLGAPKDFCIRPGYVARERAEAGASDTTSLSASEERALAATKGLASRVGAAISGGANGDAARVVESHFEIERHPSPDESIATLAARMREGSVLVLSTRVRPMSLESDHPGPPDDTRLLREWTFPELHAFLDAGGFDVLFGGVLAGDAYTAVMIGARR